MSREFYKLWRFILVWYSWNMSVWPRFFMDCFDLPADTPRWRRIHCVGVELGPMDLKLVMRPSTQEIET